MTLVRRGSPAAGAALLLIGAALAAGLLPVLHLGVTQGLERIDAYIVRVLTFTLVQAGLSTLISVALGTALARALARRQRFYGRTVLVRLLNLPLALPAIVAIIGIIEVYGTRGWLGGGLDIYGLQGILLAHAFFNVPLAARLVLAELERIPQESWNLAAQLGFGPADSLRLVEWPAIRTALPGTALLIFLLCASSFAIVLTLGGGPRATTLEVAIYQSLRADFDPPRAAMLALVQLALCVSLGALAQRLGGLVPGWPGLGRAPRRFDGRDAGARLGDGAVIAAGLVLLLPPLAAVAAAGLVELRLSMALLTAAATSVGLASASAGVALGLVWPLADRAARDAGWKRYAGVAVLAAWIVPPAVLATGWFMTLIAHAGRPGVAVSLVVAMNALMALPFAYHTLAPALAQQAAAHDRLCLNLGIAGWTRFRVIDLPALRRPAALAGLMAFILSLGDLTAIALFGTQDVVTLPALIYRQMGSYRFDEAIGTALLLGLMVLGLITLAERWSGRR